MQHFKIITFTVLLVSVHLNVRADAINVFDYAEPQNTHKVYQYKSEATGAQPWEIDGRLVESPAESESIGGKQYRARIQKAENLPDYFPAESKVYYREHEGGLYTAYYETTEQFSEFLQAPAPIEVGMTWHGPSGFWDTETLESVGEFDSPAGKFERCLTIKRSKTITDPAQQLTSISVLCPGVGGVHSVTEHQMDGSRSSTETLLIELRNQQ
ncbi:MAG: hypothetical protein ACR2QW_19025 [bacterium]